MWVYYNPNPKDRRTIDCTVRALTKALNVDWDTAFLMLSAKAFDLKLMSVSNATWGAVLRDHGFVREAIPNTCPECYTADEFCDDHPKGIYVLAFDSHVAVAEDGMLYDSWDSGAEIPQFYWQKKES